MMRPRGETLAPPEIWFGEFDLLSWRCCFPERAVRKSEMSGKV